MPPAQPRPLDVRRLSRRAALAGGLALAAAPLVPRTSLADTLLAPGPDPDIEGQILGTGTRAFGFPEPDMTSQIVRPIVFPVRGPVRWTDTYGACRSGCTRRHEGQDLMAGKMQQLVACVDGTVVGLKHSADGNYLFLRDAEGWHYGYLHVNNDTPGTDDGANRYEQAFAPGIAIGSRVRQGDVIAYVGDSGNAEGTAPHCHFEIRKPAANWYRAQAINPKPSLDHAGTGRPKVDPAAFAPWDTAVAFVAQQYLDILDRSADPDGLTQFTGELDRGLRTPASLVESFLASPEGEQYVGATARLYLGYFNRVPDAEGLHYWVAQRRRGVTLGQVSEHFARSPEFVGAYGGLDDAGFVERVYLNVLRRSSDPGGKGYWLDLLKKGVSRGGVMVNFTESSEYRDRQRAAVTVALVYTGMLRRTPDDAGYMYWVDQIGNRGTAPVTMIQQIQFGEEYRQRFS